MSPKAWGSYWHKDLRAQILERKEIQWDEHTHFLLRALDNLEYGVRDWEVSQRTSAMGRKVVVLGNIKGLESKRLEIWAFKSAKFKGQERGEGAEKWAWHLAPAFPPGIWQVVWSKRLWGYRESN